MSSNEQERAEWRAEHTPPLNYIDERILALLDELDAAEAQSEERRLDAAHWEHEYDLVNEALDAAETALRDMEIERNMLRITTRELTEALEAGDACGAVGCRAFARAESAEAALARVKALADGYDAYPGNTWVPLQVRRDLRAALAGPSPTDEGGES